MIPLPDPTDVYYTALFVDDPAALLERFPPRHEKTYAHHSTIAYRPTTLTGLEVGRKTRLQILGRATDDKGDVLLVRNTKSENEFPHITLSCAEGVPSTYSNELLKRAIDGRTLELFEPPHYVDVTEGYLVKGEKAVTDETNQTIPRDRGPASTGIY